MAFHREGLLGLAGMLKPALAGLCGLLVGIGLGRFAYTPLLPALISGQWFSASTAAYLGAANLAGYLAGALFGHRMTRMVSAHWLLRSMMVLTALSFFACGRRELGVAWFFLWRVVSGYAGGVIMVVGAPAVLSVIPPARRGLAGGVMFTGVGLGIAASGTLVPSLIAAMGIKSAWIGLGALAFGLTALTWTAWPRRAVELDAPESNSPSAFGDRLSPVRLLVLEYGLNAVGLVPHMLFLVDYVARGLARGLHGRRV